MDELFGSDGDSDNEQRGKNALFSGYKITDDDYLGAVTQAIA